MPKKQCKAFDNSVEIVASKINENGYLVIECIFARTGIQERYGAEISPDFEALKIYREYRSPEEVFKPDVIEAFKNVVITNDHPSKLLTPQNTKFFAVGFVSSAVEIVDNLFLKCEITIFDEETIEDIQNGKKELSAGYLYSLLMVENEDYDYIQTDIKPNHIAIVQAGRCGSSCSLAFDSNPNKRNDMKKIVFKRKLPDGSDEIICEIEVSDESEEAVQGVANLIYDNSVKEIEANKAIDEDVDESKKESDAKDEEIALKDDEIARLQALIDTKTENVATDAKISLIAHDMARVMVVAMDLGIETVGKNVCSLKKSVIAKVKPDLALDGKSKEYIGYAFDEVATQLKNADRSFVKGLDMKLTPAQEKAQKTAMDAKDKFNSKYGGTK